MCGIFGVVVKKEAKKDPLAIQALLRDLFIFSESRGKESAGISLANKEEILLLKDSVPANKFIKCKEYRELFARFYQKEISYGYSIIAHSRLVTNGTSQNNSNNQPVISGDCVGVHNGIVVNVDEIWKRHESDLKRNLEVDSEVIFSLINNKMNEGASIELACKTAFSEIVGTASIAAHFKYSDNFLLATNNGSLYYLFDQKRELFVFASEFNILACALKPHLKNLNISLQNIQWLKPSCGFVLSASNFNGMLIDLAELQNDISEKEAFIEDATPTKRKVVDISIPRKKAVDLGSPILDLAKMEEALEYNLDEILALRRCTKCVLPETFPYITFDDQGVCNYCHNYQSPPNYNNRQALEDRLKKFRNEEGRDCIVAMSGGRDSSYGLHLVVKELNMRPITFTYDWGMVTDLARRNIALMCGELGIENILISADIAKKRGYIRKNVAAWLKRPSLGIIPLFMAGDKYFLRYVNRLKKETGIKLDIWSANHYENTDFKSGFCGIPPAFHKKRIDQMGLRAKLRMPMFYLKEYMLNPDYINSSIPDTIGAYWSYYVEPRTEFCLLFDYLNWDEAAVENCLINDYGWETNSASKSTWRIGDGTAAFYNYIYYTVAGFSEYETFRSNQVREGLMSREEALQRTCIENMPNFQSILWYLQTIGLDFGSSIKRINGISKLYRK
ncbi:MAG: hypothetical protein R2772_11810 [Chitinophagales bacterium]